MKFLTQYLPKNNPYFNFVKTLSFFMGVGILMLIVVLVPMEANKYPTSKLDKLVVLQMIFFVFGLISSMIYAVLTLAFVISKAFNALANRFTFIGVTDTYSIREYLINMGLIALAASISYGAIAGYLYVNY